MRTRDAGMPSASAGSIETDVMGLFALAVIAWALMSAATLRKSTRTVRGSGRVVTYGTGALASITSVAPLPWAREEIAVSRGAAADEVGGPDAWANAPRSVTDTKRARPFVTFVMPCRPRAFATACESAAVSRATADRL